MTGGATVGNSHFEYRVPLLKKLLELSVLPWRLHLILEKDTKRRTI
jgi:hypothetical protein